MKKPQSPFWMLFGFGLYQMVCKHKGPHDEWSYQVGSGITKLYCSRCGKIIKTIALDDLPNGQLIKVVKLFKQNEDEECDD